MPAVYATLADLLARFDEAELVQLTDEAGAGVVNQARVDRALRSAAGTIEAHLAAAYQLPLTRIPDVLVDLACDIAIHRLYRTAPPELVEKRFTEANKTLVGIAAGRVKIDAGVQEQTPRDGAVLIGDGEAIFTREKMRGF
jgi:phage gp36-like protein